MLCNSFCSLTAWLGAFPPPECRKLWWKQWFTAEGVKQVKQNMGDVSREIKEGNDGKEETSFLYQHFVAPSLFSALFPCDSRNWCLIKHPVCVITHPVLPCLQLKCVFPLTLPAFTRDLLKPAQLCASSAVTASAVKSKKCLFNQTLRPRICLLSGVRAIPQRAERLIWSSALLILPACVCLEQLKGVLVFLVMCL